jgi:SAM-dependent methyltransferase
MKLPPPKMREKIWGDFTNDTVWIDSGAYSFSRLKDVYGIKSTDTVLDLACGCGRVTGYFEGFLSHYYGIDSNQAMITWCANNYPSFEFIWADVKNWYTPNGKYGDYEYTFPLLNSCINFGFAFSLFTHLLELGARRYLKEIYRILKPGGRFMLSVFILDDCTTSNIKAGTSKYNFPYDNTGNCKYCHRNNPEETVGYTLIGLQDMIHGAGLKIDKTYRGTWSENASDNQDEIVLVK